MNRSIVLTFHLLLLSKVFGNRISQTKCEYYQSIFPPTSKTFNDSDENAEPKEFPFMAKVFGDNGTYSNGILISENFVLTIALNDTAKHVILGDLYNSTHTNVFCSQRYDVIKEIRYPHPKFNLHPSHTIKLLKLNELVKFNDYIRPTCLPQPKSNISQRLMEVGWSETSIRNNKLLHKVKLNLVLNRKCEKEMTRGGFHELYTRGIDDGSHFCAVANVDKRDTCHGFGGAAVLNDDGSSNFNRIVGIASVNSGCGKEYPNLFVRVSEYISWIESIVWSSENEYIESTTDLESLVTTSEADTDSYIFETSVTPDLSSPIISNTLTLSSINLPIVTPTPFSRTTPTTPYKSSTTGNGNDNIKTTSTKFHRSSYSDNSAKDDAIRKSVFVILLFIAFIWMCISSILFIYIQKYKAKNRRNIDV